MHALGKHLLLELKDCDPSTLDSLELLRDALLTAAKEVGATIIGDSFHRFEPHGISGVVIIAESHLCIHTWPEYRYAAVDIFTCGDEFDPENAASLLIQRLGARDPWLMEVKRGVLGYGQYAGKPEHPQVSEKK
ncbi:MAG: adenosylmethionine decarboxylase [Chloroflexi bacterium]|nr:adenosylmethionine decarboxylase [Chloroflexota bacterium]